MEKNTHTPRPLHLAQAEPLLRERLEATVVLTVTGGSMLPLLAGGRDRVTLGAGVRSCSTAAPTAAMCCIA